MTGTANSGEQIQVSPVRELRLAPEPREEVHPAREARGWPHIGAVLRTYRGQLAVAVLLAAGARLFILIMAHGMMDGDEAVLGIQAERILQGARPIYFAGQSYMGSWDAYLAAPLVALLGPSAWPLHLVTLAESLLLIPLLGSLAARLFGTRARFPAMLLAAIPPEYVAVGELRMLGGYVETLVLGTALLLLATHVAARWREGRPTLAQWLLIGLLTGLALWIDVLIAYYLVAGALWLAPYAIGRARRGWEDGWRWVRSAIIAGTVWLAAMLIAATPAIIYALQNRLANITFVTGHPAWLDHVSQLRGSVLLYLFTHDLPSVFGLRLSWHTPAPLALLLEAVAGLCAVAALAYVLSRIFAMGVTRRTLDTLVAGVWAHWNDVLPFLLLGALVVFYWRSSNSALVYAHPAQDAGGRYALPATTALSLVLARVFVALSGRRVGGGVPVSGRGAHARLAPALLVLLLVVYAIPYVASDAVYAMKSPEAQNTGFPAEDTELLSYLDQHHITYLWSDQSMCHLIMYLENQRLVCGEWVDVYEKQAVNRFPEAIQAAAAADRASFVIAADPARGEPEVARALDALGVTYTSWHVGSIWVITPVSRTVQPQEIGPALLQDY